MHFGDSLEWFKFGGGIKNRAKNWTTVASGADNWHWLELRFRFFLKIFLEDISPFCGGTDTPVVDFW